MVAIDTNVVVRLLTGDDPAQSARARAVFRRGDVFIPETVLLETEWVLRHAYDFKPLAIHQALVGLCGLPNIILQNPHRLLTGLQWYAEGMDFADAVHLAASQDCRTFYSFDQKLIRQAADRGRCKAKQP
jgi:predicted nucleic-acid-binding protein